jgi:hypothetical protein
MLHLLANRVANALCVRPHQAAALRLFEIKCAWFTEQREKIERPGEPARSNVVNYSELARREDFTANSRSWLDHAVSLDLEGREIGVPHHRWRRVKPPKPLETERCL